MNERLNADRRGESAGAAGRRTGPVLVAGVGNLLLSDDGVGIHAVQRLRQEPWPGVEVVDLGTAVLHGVDFLESAGRVLILDAVRGGRPPGTLYRFDLPLAQRPQVPGSIHALGLCEAARLLLDARAVPPMTVLGVEPAVLEYGTELSPAVQAALPALMEWARATVAGWMASPATSDVSRSRESADLISTQLIPEML